MRRYGISCALDTGRTVPVQMKTGACEGRPFFLLVPRINHVVVLAVVMMLLVPVMMAMLRVIRLRVLRRVGHLRLHVSLLLLCVIVGGHRIGIRLRVALLLHVVLRLCCVMVLRILILAGVAITRGIVVARCIAVAARVMEAMRMMMVAMRVMVTRVVMTMRAAAVVTATSRFNDVRLHSGFHRRRSDACRRRCRDREGACSRERKHELFHF